MQQEITIRQGLTITAEVRQLMEKLSEHYGSSLSGLIRMLILEEARKIGIK